MLGKAARKFNRTLIFCLLERKTIRNEESSIQSFLNAVGTSHSDPWNEEIWGVEVRIDGEFAQVWCNYTFYIGKKFSHCGVDAFQLYFDSTGWKIFHLSDTRRATNCAVLEEISLKYLSDKK